MQNLVGATLQDQEIVIDDKVYVNCTFVNCKIIYAGGDHSLINVKFDNCQIMFAGQAEKTAVFMQTVGILPRPGLPPVQLPESGSFH